MRFTNFTLHEIKQYIVFWDTRYVTQKLHSLSRFATLRAISNLFSFFIHSVVWIIQGVSKKLNKTEIAHRLCKTSQCTKSLIEIGCLGTDDVV